MGILEFWVCLHPQVELTEPQMERVTCSTAVRYTRGSEWALGEPEVNATTYHMVGTGIFRKALRPFTL